LSTATAELQSRENSLLRADSIYNRGGHLVGTVIGADIEEVKRYVTQDQRLIDRRVLWQESEPELAR
jgi:hypothetical protein